MAKGAKAKAANEAAAKAKAESAKEAAATAKAVEGNAAADKRAAAKAAVGTKRSSHATDATRRVRQKTGGLIQPTLMHFMGPGQASSSQGGRGQANSGRASRGQRSRGQASSRQAGGGKASKAVSIAEAKRAQHAKAMREFLRKQRIDAGGDGKSRGPWSEEDTATLRREMSRRGITTRDDVRTWRTPPVITGRAPKEVKGKARILVQTAHQLAAKAAAGRKYTAQKRRAAGGDGKAQGKWSSEDITALQEAMDRAGIKSAEAVRGWESPHIRGRDDADVKEKARALLQTPEQRAARCAVQKERYHDVLRPENLQQQAKRYRLIFEGLIEVLGEGQTDPATVGYDAVAGGVWLAWQVRHGSPAPAEWQAAHGAVVYARQHGNLEGLRALFTKRGSLAQKLRKANGGIKGIFAEFGGVQPYSELPDELKPVLQPLMGAMAPSPGADSTSLVLLSADTEFLTGLCCCCTVTESHRTVHDLVSHL